MRTTYTEAEVDLFGVYCGELDRCFLLPVAVAAGKHLQHLRLKPALNNQRACITLADDFDFDGAIAQLGERCHGMAEVVGSSPTSSTSRPLEVGGTTQIGSHEFRERFGYWMDRVAAGERVVVSRHGRPVIRLEPADAAADNRQAPDCLAASSAAGGSSAALPRVSSSARSARSAASAPPTDSSPRARARST
jgi:prevent-host-death family protein